ncbi:GNAT superfamily N-acetyltransferase [Catenuloplanes nepalensis]|uniref:GNAT superfamily N-acetyltransferase n=1 Tax=Catenuloplanes nepalensis TaxID=587533 RepID=A0ABT9N7M5_9ACTN|nr:GNAT family N-acetyltransferase [Catenuloplanes nepalensis]MDP9799703.1 GNAT superfamily N-acetyltransferase [Catenuloplanes nepalensis]
MNVAWRVDPELDTRLQEEIVDLWHAASEAGGAVGFVPPVERDAVAALARATFASVLDGEDRLLVGHEDGRLVGLLFFAGNRSLLRLHWCTLKRVMVHPETQGRGYGRALLAAAERVARDSGWEALHLTVRAGNNTERFYQRAGYKEVGRLPGAIRVAPGDDRDEIHMWLPLR